MRSLLLVAATSIALSATAADTPAPDAALKAAEIVMAKALAPKPEFNLPEGWTLLPDGNILLPNGTTATVHHYVRPAGTGKCYYIRTVRPVTPETLEESRDPSSTLKEPRFIPLQARVLGTIDAPACAKEGEPIHAVYRPDDGAAKARK